MCLFHDGITLYEPGNRGSPVYCTVLCINTRGKERESIVIETLANARRGTVKEAAAPIFPYSLKCRSRWPDGPVRGGIKVGKAAVPGPLSRARWNGSLSLLLEGDMRSGGQRGLASASGARRMRFAHRQLNFRTPARRAARATRPAAGNPARYTAHAGASTRQAAAYSTTVLYKRGCSARNEATD